MTTTHTGDTREIRTLIPEGHRVDGLEYGAHVSFSGWSGHYVRPEDTDEWVIARMTPADDELVGDDAEIVTMIAREIAGRVRDDDTTPDDDELVGAEIGVTHCECGTWTGERCEWTGPIAETVVVEYMPPYLRASHAAAGNAGCHPMNGSWRVRVEISCADRLLDDETEREWAEVRS